MERKKAEEEMHVYSIVNNNSSSNADVYGSKF